MVQKTKQEISGQHFFDSAPQSGHDDVLYKLAKFHGHEWALAAQDFWYFANFIKTDDEDIGKVRPFPTDYAYLRDLKHQIDTHQKVIILKPRRHMLSWLGVMDMLHCGMFAGSGVPDTYETFRGGIATIGETEALYMIERIATVYQRFPDWMKDRNPLAVNNKMMLKFENGATIQAFPMKKEGPQSFGFTKFFFDELALQDAARSTWTGMIPTLGHKGKLLAVSTPNGKLNFFYDVWSNRDDAFKNIHRIECSWRDNPEHDDEWFAAVTDGMDKQMIARMFEKSFAPYAGKPVWGEFEYDTHVVDETFIDIARPMIYGWDFGYARPVIIFAQYNTRDQFVIHREYRDYDISFNTFCDNAIIFGGAFFNIKIQPSIHFVDPSGFARYHNRAKSGAMSDVAEIKLKFGKDTQVRAGSLDTGTAMIEGPRLKEVRKLWRLRDDGRPGIVINKSGCETLIEGCQGAYCYAEKRDNERPLKNEASDPQDGLQYLVTGYNRLARPDQVEKFTRKQKILRISTKRFRTGL